MSYDSFDYSRPDATIDDGLAMCDETRKNLLAIRDAIIGGSLTGWQIDVTDTGSDGFPDVVTYTNQGDAVAGDSDEVVRLTITWNGDGTPATIKFEYSSTATPVWNAIGTPVAPLGLLTLSYAGTGLLSQGVWT